MLKTQTLIIFKYQFPMPSKATHCDQHFLTLIPKCLPSSIHKGSNDLHLEKAMENPASSYLV